MSKLPEIEKDRAMVCEISLDQLRDLDERYGILDARQRRALLVLQVTNPFNGFGDQIGPFDFAEIKARGDRIKRVMDKLTETFPVDEPELEAAE